MVLKSIAEHITSSPKDCLILISPSVHRLEQSSGEIEKDLLIPVIEIGKELSIYLVGIQRDDRPRAISRWFEERLSSLKPGPTMCNHIDFLFEPVFSLDPLNLFRQASRTTKLVVQWPGEYANGILSYAVAGHKHYRTWRITDLNIDFICLSD
jgi:hypothetical protein